jgi:hypothetical protein
MKKLLLLLLCIPFFNCSVSTSSNVDVNPSDIKYFKDGRTNLCYGIIASRQFGSTDTSGLGVTCVPCKNVEQLLE